MKKSEIVPARSYAGGKPRPKDVSEIVAESEERVRRFLEELEVSDRVTYRPKPDKSQKKTKPS